MKKGEMKRGIEKILNYNIGKKQSHRHIDINFDPEKIFFFLFKIVRPQQFFPFFVHWIYCISMFDVHNFHHFFFMNNRVCVFCVVHQYTHWSLSSLLSINRSIRFVRNSNIFDVIFINISSKNSENGTTDHYYYD